MKIKKDVVNCNKAAINKRIRELKKNEYVRARQFTPREVLKLMGVDDKYIKRMLSPEYELSNYGFTSDEINKLLTVDGLKVSITDKCLYERAGNAIVVNVLYYLFESLLVPPDSRIK